MHFSSCRIVLVQIKYAVFAKSDAAALFGYSTPVSSGYRQLPHVSNTGMPVR